MINLNINKNRVTEKRAVELGAWNSECFAAAVELQVFFPLSKGLQVNSQQQLGFKPSLFQCLFSHFFSLRVLCVCARARVCPWERERETIVCMCVCVFFSSCQGSKAAEFQELWFFWIQVFSSTWEFFPFFCFCGLFQRRILSTGTNFFSFLHFSFCGEFFFPGKLISNKPRSSLSSSTFVFCFVLFCFFSFPLSLFFLFELVNFVFLLCLTVFSHLHHSWNLATAGLTYLLFLPLILRREFLKVCFWHAVSFWTPLCQLLLLSFRFPCVWYGRAWDSFSSSILNCRSVGFTDTERERERSPTSMSVV